jgi:hypothetical protein
MGNPQNQYRAALVVNPADDAVRADAVSPESYFVSREGFAHASRVIASRDAFFEEPHQPLLRGPVQFPEFVQGAGVKINGPSQVV